MPLKIKKKPTIFIASPEYAGLHAWTRSSLNQALMYTAQSGFQVLEPYAPHGISLVPQARRDIAGKFLQSSAEWLLSVDSDMIFPKDIFQRLHLHGTPIAAALCVRKQPPHMPTVAKLEKREDEWVPVQVLDPPLDKAFKLDGKIADCMGLAISITHREVFEKTEKPWYYCPKCKVGGGVILGEDWVFCLNAKKAGFEITADPVVGQQCFHIGDYPFGLRDYLAYKQKGWSEAVEDIGLSDPESFRKKYRGVRMVEGLEVKKEFTPTAE